MDILVFLAAAAILVVYGVYKHAKVEDNDYKKLIEVVTSLRAGNSILKKDLADVQSSIALQKSEVEAVQTAVSTLVKDNEAAQEHMARLRKSQIELRDRSYPRTVELRVSTPTGPIPIEFYTNPNPPKAPTPTPPPKKLMKKIKSQMDKLNQ